MPANIGSQKITILYHTAANSGEVNLRHLGIRQLGIYEGGYLSIVDTSNAQISPLVCEISGGTHQVRGETTIAVNLLVGKEVAGTPYVVLRWAYTGATSDYMQILAVASPDPEGNDLVIGKCTYSGGGDLNGFDYSERSTPNTQDLFLKVEAPDSTMIDKMKVRVRAGRIQTNVAIIQIKDRPTPFAFTHSGGGSTEYGLVYIDTSGAVQIVDASGNTSIPLYAGKMVLAEVAITSATLEITQSMITDVRSWISVTLKDPFYFVAKRTAVQANAVVIWTKLNFDTVKQNGITVSNGVVTLPAGKLYKMSYSVSYRGLSYTPAVVARLRVISGDTTWGFSNDAPYAGGDDRTGAVNISTQVIELGRWPTVEAPKVATLSGTYFILPSAETTIQLEALTKDGSTSYGKVIKCSLSIWSN